MFKVTLTVSVLWTVLLAVVFFQVNAQEPLTSDNPPPILIQADSFGADSVLDSLQSLRAGIDKAQAELDSLMPVSNFVSSAHRAAFYKAAADMKKANVAMFSYMASVDPNNRLSWLQKARQSKKQCDLAMGEYYKALPSEEVQIQHTRLTLSN